MSSKVTARAAARSEIGSPYRMFWTSYRKGVRLSHSGRKDDIIAEGEPKRKRVNGRAKGAGFERDIANTFRAWLGEGWTVKRMPTDFQKGQLRNVAGEFEIEAPEGSPKFCWCVECKNELAFDYMHLWTGTGPFGDYYDQACRQARICGRRPLLIFKRNFGPILAAVREDDWLILGAPAERSMVITLFTGSGGAPERVLILAFAEFIALASPTEP